MNTRTTLSVLLVAGPAACASQPTAVKVPAGHTVAMETATAGDILY